MTAQGWTSDAAKDVIDRRERERLERWEGKRPLFDSAYTKGDFALAEPGCEVFAKVGGDLVNVRMRADGEPRGGIILEIAAAREITDDGEIRDRRAFRCFDYDPRVPIWQATTTLTEAQCDPLSFTAPNWGRLRGVCRRLCAEVGRQRGVMSAAEIQMVVDAFRLVTIIGQRHG